MIPVRVHMHHETLGEIYHFELRANTELNVILNFIESISGYNQ